MYCSNCGCEISKRIIRLRRSQKSGSPICDSCNSVTKVKTKFGQCFAHNGSFDAGENPVNKFGSKILPGYRKCGHRDCVNREHIIPAVEFERYSVQGGSWAEKYNKIVGELNNARL